MTGTRLGNWILGESLGRGAHGSVWKAQAFEQRPDEPATAVVKVLDEAMAREPSFQQRFPGEMLALRRLTHPNLARYYDAGVQAGLVYSASELAPGRDLAKIIADRPEWREHFFRVAIQCCRALKHAHHRSILHRDLKPSNIIVDANGAVKVTDFGFAKAFHVPPLALPVEPFGTACYLAPEHFTGKPLTRKSDLYALGGVLYTLVCGRPPFLASAAPEYMHKHCYMLPDRPIMFVPKLPPEVDDLICGLLAKDPAKRPASAAAVLDDLEHLRTKLERKGESLLMPPEAVDPTGLHAPLGLTPGAAIPAVNASARTRDKVLRGSVLIGLFIGVVGLILFAFLKPRPSAEELWTQAEPLIASENPDDWDKARVDYVDKLERWYPGNHSTEIDELKLRIADRRELRRVLSAGATTSATPMRESERRYRRGLAFAASGDFASAKAEWEHVGKPVVESDDHRWWNLAQQGMSEIQRFSLQQQKQ